MRWSVPGVVFAALVGACSSGGSQPPNSNTPSSLSRAEASRFLARATFGPTDDDIAEVQRIGYRAWLDAQMTLPPTLTAEEIPAGICVIEHEELGGRTCPSQALLEEGIVMAAERRENLWWRSALWAPDQLRQRVAFALSEIFVVSVRGELEDLSYTVGRYADMLAANAFGNYRDLLEAVTLHPAMGAYLSMAKNRKPDPIENTRPDENYAREIMQLFSIGLTQLNADGSDRLDASGNSIPTYDQDVIVGMAHALTGWNFAGFSDVNLDEWLDAPPRIGPMESSRIYHDLQPKLLVTGKSVPGMQTAAQDLASALDLLAAHANVGPFLGKQLIQRLVTSNPSPAYVARVSAVFDDNGRGVRGDLGAVVRAILLDSEALNGHRDRPDEFGKLREPLLCATALLRAFGVDRESGTRGLVELGEDLRQRAYAAPSVFNFFRPDYASPDLRGQGLVAPEMQIWTHTSAALVANVLGYYVFDGYVGSESGDFDWPRVRIDREIAMAADPPRLVRYLDELLLGGTLSDTTRNSLTNYIASIDADEGVPAGSLRVVEAIHLLMISPDFAVQK